MSRQTDSRAACDIRRSAEGKLSTKQFTWLGELVAEVDFLPAGQTRIGPPADIRPTDAASWWRTARSLEKRGLVQCFKGEVSLTPLGRAEWKHARKATQVEAVARNQ